MSFQVMSAFEGGCRGSVLNTKRNLPVAVRLPAARCKPIVKYAARNRFQPSICEKVVRWKLFCASTSEGVAPVTTEEEKANKKRWEESGNKQGSIDQWRWTLNWDDITDKIVVGSCPRSLEDMDRLIDEAHIDAVLCLQSDLCHDALQIKWPAIRQRAVERGVMMTRVAVRDFDKNDQAIMLPEAVRCLHLLQALGLRVYVHCTAGINRATLTVVGYLTFVKGMALEDAVDMVKTARPQAHPYIDCWKMVRARLVADRNEEVAGLARHIYAMRMEESVTRNKNDDWYAAEDMLIQETFKRQRDATLSMFSSLQAIYDRKLQEAQLASSAALASAEAAAAAVQANGPVVLVNAANGQPLPLEQELGEDDLMWMPEECTIQLGAARKELEELKDAIAEVANTAHTLLEVQGEEPNAANGANGATNAANGAEQKPSPSLSPSSSLPEPTSVAITVSEAILVGSVTTAPSAPHTNGANGNGANAAANGAVSNGTHSNGNAAPAPPMPTPVEDVGPSSIKDEGAVEDAGDKK